jgi:hypothetical protein
MSKIVVDQIQRTGGVALTLPISDGTAGQVLVTNSSGALSFHFVLNPNGFALFHKE